MTTSSGSSSGANGCGFSTETRFPSAPTEPRVAGTNGSISTQALTQIYHGSTASSSLARCCSSPAGSGTTSSPIPIRLPPTSGSTLEWSITSSLRWSRMASRLSRHWARAGVGRHSGSPLRLPARRPASPSFGDFLYISYTSTISIVFHDSPCSCSVYSCLYVCAFAYLCSTSFVVGKGIGPSLSSVLCKPTRLGAIALQRVMVGQSSIPDEQPPGVMVWRRVLRHLSVGQLGRFVA